MLAMAARASRVVCRRMYFRCGTSGASPSQQTIASTCRVTAGGSPGRTIMSPRPMSMSSSRSSVTDCSLVARWNATSEQSVTLLLEDDIDIGRGDMIVRPGDPPAVTRQVDAMVCWLGDAPLVPQRKYILRHTTREARAAIASIDYRVDVNE